MKKQLTPKAKIMVLALIGLLPLGVIIYALVSSIYDDYRNIIFLCLVAIVAIGYVILDERKK